MPNLHNMARPCDEEAMLEMVRLRKALDAADERLEACSCDDDFADLEEERDVIQERFDQKEMEVCSIEGLNFDDELMSLLRTGAYEASDLIRENVLDGQEDPDSALYCFMKHGDPDILDRFLGEHLSCEMDCDDRWCFKLAGHKLCTSAFEDVGAVRGARAVEIARVLYEHVNGHVEGKGKSDCSLTCVPFEIVAAFLKHAIKLQDTALFRWAIEAAASYKVERADTPLGWGIVKG